MSFEEEIKLEKNKKLFTYDPSVHDYSTDKPQLTDIGHGHFVYGNEKEIAEYRAIREKNVPLKSVTILDPNSPDTDAEVNASIPTADPIIDTPVHDTGSFWYSLGSFFLPIVGLIGGAIFKRHNYIRNYKACKKGAIAGLVTLGAIIGLFLAALGISLL